MIIFNNILHINTLDGTINITYTIENRTYTGDFCLHDIFGTWLIGANLVTGCS